MEEKATTPSTSTHISLSLPRFKYDYDLKQFMNVLINMGIAVYKNTSIVDKPNYNVININFDKSFLYMIRDKETKNVLFIGVVDSPNEWAGSTCDSNE